MDGTEPPVAAARCRLDQSASGACGAQDCQAEITRAACDHGQDRKNRTIWPTGWVRKVNEVTTPKLPPPPPRQAQYSAGVLVGGGAEGERGAPAEVPPAPATAGPVQVGVLAGVARPDLAVSRDDLQRLHVVAGHPVSTGHHSADAAQGEAGHA